MQQSISFRVKGTDGKWDIIPLADFGGMTIAELLEQMDGQEVVAELVVSSDGREWKGYLCGTEKWVEHYRKKGFSSKGFMEGIEILREKQSPLLGDIIPGEVGEMVEDVFTGSKIEKVEFGLFD